MDKLSGSVVRVTYFNEENGYTVLRLKPDQSNIPGLSRGGLATVVGNLPEISPGEHLSLEGRWSTHAKYGTQFAVEVCKQTLPATVEGLKRYLGSGLIKGIGPQLAERIVEHFEQDTLEIIEDQPQRLSDVPGIGPQRSRKIKTAWQEQKEVKEIMLFLHSHGVSTNLAVKIYKAYGEESLAVVQEDPYQLERDIYGIGFKTADSIAQNLGLPPDHPSRMEAGVIYALEEMINEGHVYAPRSLLTERAQELLEADPDLIDAALERLVERDRVRADQIPLHDGRSPGTASISEPGTSPSQPTTDLYLTPFYHAETGVAERMKTLSGHLLSRLSDIPPAFIEKDQDLKEGRVSLSVQQKSAVHTALSHPVSVLTGGPGTGKTTCLKYLISILDSQEKSYALTSPTGRAAKHLSLATDRPASTLHRLLGFSPQKGFKHNLDNPLPVDIVVVDEASMLDLLLTYNLLKALEPGTHLLLVGDVDQLPSVGAGNVLRDIITSGIAPITRLEAIFRQAADSHIVLNAHRINQGKMPVFPQRDQTERRPDFYLFPAKDAQESGDWIIDLVGTRIPQEFGFHPVEDVQVLAPMYRGAAGVDTLNQRLQETLNPPAPNKLERSLLGTLYRKGDKVMQTQNNYPKNVYNGDIGTLQDINTSEQTLTVDFDGAAVEYEWNEANQLVLAYAVSVHKAQGSEFPVVVLPVLTQHYIMLQRNLLYTAITRAQKLCVLSGNMRAIAIAVRNNKVDRRYSGLDWRLAGP